MSRYVIKRLLMMLFVLIGVAVLIFTVMYFVPGDPALTILGPTATAEELQLQREHLGLEQPYLVRLGQFLYQTFLQFDFGTSYMTSVPVVEELALRVPITILLSLGFMAVKIIVGIPLGVVAAVKRNKWQDKVCMLIALVGVSLPNFLVALMLVLVFSVNLNILPAFGTGGFEYYIMPIIAGSLVGLATQARQTRSSMLDVIRADYVTTARAKGVSEWRIIVRHVIPNGLIPVIQVLGNGLGAAMAGALVVEKVFSIPGLGVYLTSAVSQRDYPVVQSCVLVLALIFSLIMLLVDLAFAFVDPRIKAQYEGHSKSTKKKKAAMVQAVAKAETATAQNMAPYVLEEAKKTVPHPLDAPSVYVYELPADYVQEEAMEVVVAAEPVKEQKNSFFRVVAHRMVKNNKTAVGALVVLAVIMLAGILAPVIAPYGYEKMDLINTFATPTAEHWFGTDNFGRDIFSRVLYGARYSIGIGVGSQVLPLIVGLLLGCMAGFFGGAVDSVIMRLLDILQAIPYLLLAVIISSALGGGIINTILALSIPEISNIARLSRAQFLSLRSQEYVEAAASINCSKARQIVKHILPNTLSPVIVTVTMDIGRIIMAASQLSYIGLGIRPPTPEWGAMIVDGQEWFRFYPHLILFPGLVLAIVVLCFNMFGDGLRDAMDPKLKN